MKRILILTTGGTIEKIYNEFDGTLFNKDSKVREKIIKGLRLPATELETINLMAKDSLAMTLEDRQLIVETLKREEKKGIPIIVIHGTDTMDQTAELVFHEIKSPRVPILFTGAMKPMDFGDSDALQNITESLMAAQLLSPGVYICFHNQVLPLPSVRKNKLLGGFEKI